MSLPETCDRRNVRCIQVGSVREDDIYVSDGLVGILACSAAHSAGVVGCYTSDHRRVNGCRVRSDLFPETGQKAVCHSTSYARSETYLLSPYRYAVVPESVGSDNQNGVRERLATQRCSCRPEGYRNIHLVGHHHYLPDFRG